MGLAHGFAGLQAPPCSQPPVPAVPGSLAAGLPQCVSTIGLPNWMNFPFSTFSRKTVVLKILENPLVGLGAVEKLLIHRNGSFLIPFIALMRVAGVRSFVCPTASFRNCMPAPP